MKTFSIILALLCCYTFSFAQFSNPIQLQGSWEISIIESSKDVKKDIFKPYLGQKVHFLEDKKLILETDEGYYFTTYAYNYNKLIFAGRTYDVSINTAKQLILGIDINNGFRPYKATYTLNAIPNVDTIKFNDFNSLISKEELGGISTQGFYYRFDTKKRKNTFVRLLPDSTLIFLSDTRSPADIYHHLNNFYMLTKQVSYNERSFTMIHSETYKHQLYDKSIITAYAKSDFRMQDGTLQEDLLKYTFNKDTLDNLSYSYQYIPTNKLGYWFKKMGSKALDKENRIYPILLIPPQISTTEIREIFKVVEEMPRFPGCETEPPAKRKKCADKLMQKYIEENVVYPVGNKNSKNEVTAVVQFIVKKDGSLEDIRVVRDPGLGTGEAAERVVHKMKEDGIIWIPGKQRGRPVNVMFNLPVRFKL
ncbi:MAG: energy transducer TonB [Chitinophagales bacterium]|nr:energy transducer TonB [Chitinophagales bacterium]